MLEKILRDVSQVNPQELDGLPAPNNVAEDSAQKLIDELDVYPGENDASRMVKTLNNASKVLKFAADRADGLATWPKRRSLSNCAVCWTVLWLAC